MGRGIIIALLVVSLGLNVFALGHLSGRMIGHHGHVKIARDGGKGMDDPFHIMRHADELSPDLRDKVHEAFRKQLPALREEHRRMRALRGELGSLMSAEVWDKAAVEAKLAEIRAAKDKQEDAFTEAFMSAFETLPAEERKRLIDAANERRREFKKRWREKRGFRDDTPPPPPEDGEAPPPPPEEE